MKIKKDYTSPNFSKRTKDIDTIIIHQTEGKFPGCAEWMCNPESKASAHYLITKKGEIYQLVDEKDKAWHAGAAEWDYNNDGVLTREEHAINSRSIGIELESEKGETTEVQLVASKLLVGDILLRYKKIKNKNVLGHKEVSPTRKSDPVFDMNDFRNSLI